MFLSLTYPLHSELKKFQDTQQVYNCTNRLVCDINLVVHSLALLSFFFPFEKIEHLICILAWEAYALGLFSGLVTLFEQSTEVIK